MGSICCLEQDPPKPRPRLVPTQTPHTSPNQQRRILLQDFSFAVQRLTERAQPSAATHYKGMFLGPKLGEDALGEFFEAGLNTQEGVRPVVLKRTRKELMSRFQIRRSVVVEHLVTTYCDNSFIVSCIHSYEDQLWVYLFFDLSHYYHINRLTDCSINFPQTQAYRTNLEDCIRFLAAGIILGLQALQSLQIIYMGINLENIVVLANGYPQLTNLSGLCPQSQAQITQITPFSAPECSRNEPLTRSCDLWSLGILLYYLATGHLPINHNSINSYGFYCQQQKKHLVPNCSYELNDLINSLLLVSPITRLGFNDISSLKKHPFFTNFNWGAYQNFNLISPLASPYLQAQQQKAFQNTTPTSFDYMGPGILGGLLLMDLATLYFISSSFDDQGMNYPIHTDEEQNDMFVSGQQGCQVDIGGEYGGDDGGNGDD